MSWARAFVTLSALRFTGEESPHSIQTRTVFEASKVGRKAIEMTQVVIGSRGFVGICPEEPVMGANVVIKRAGGLPGIYTQWDIAVKRFQVEGVPDRDRE